MIQEDTIKLLRECDAGIKMGVSTLNDVTKHVREPELLGCIKANKTAHERLGDELRILLEQYHDDGKEPNPMAKGMSHMKTVMKLGWEKSDQTIADLVTDGCHMGIKSLSRYLNQYTAADEHSKDITKRLIALEEKLTTEMRPYL